MSARHLKKERKESRCPQDIHRAECFVGVSFWKNAAVAIALLNTVFRLATVIVLFPFISKIEKLVCWLVKDNKEDLEDEADFDLLEERLLNYPTSFWNWF